MKKRLLALLLALVLTISMLPTAFALDAAEPTEGTSAGAAEAEPPAEGETEEKPAEPEQPEAEEPAEEPEEPEQAGEEPAAEPEEAAAKEAEVATFAANSTIVFLQGTQLKNGYYLTKSAESTELDIALWSLTKPEGRENYLYYENGVLTVYGWVRVTVSKDESANAALQVVGGKLTVDGNGLLHIQGVYIPALKVNEGASVVFDFEPNDSYYSQLSLVSSWATTVIGDLLVSNAGRVLVTTNNKSDDVTYNTVDGNVAIHANEASFTNESGGVCVNGDAIVEAPDYLSFHSQSDNAATLSGGSQTYRLTTDDLRMYNECGAMVDGDIVITAVGKDERPSFWIDGCTPKGVAVVTGNLEATGGELSLVNQNDAGDRYPELKDYVAEGPVLRGNLTLTGASNLYVRRLGDGTEALFEGDVTLIDSYNDEQPGYFSVQGGKGDGAVIDGDLTMRNSQLRIRAMDNNGTLSSTPCLKNCKLSMQNSYLSIVSENTKWDSIEILDDYVWRADSKYTENPTYIKKSEQEITSAAVTGRRYLEICSGSRIPETAERSARFLGKPSLDGVVGQSMKVQLNVALTGDTLDLQKVRGYKQSTGELPASTDLSKYLTINTPAGGVWTVTTSGRTYQGDTELPLYIIGTATTTCEDVPLEMTISGDILASGEDLAVTEKDTVRWNIRASAAGVDFDNISTAEEFAKAIGGEEYAQVTGNTVTLLKGALMEKSITMTGEFTVDLNGYELYYSNAKDPVLRSGAGKQTIRGGSANGAVNYVHNSIIVTGGELTLEGVKASFVTVEDGTLHMNETAASAVDVTGGVAEVSGSTLNFAGIKDGELILRETEIKKNSTTSLRVNGGKVSIKDGTQIPCIVLVTGGEVQIDGGTFSGYEGHWLQQTGGLVSVNNGNLTGTMLVMDGELNLLGGEYSSGEDGNLGLYQSGGKVTAENVYLTSTAMKEEAEDGGTYYNHRCIWLDGGELTLKNTVVTGAVFVNDGAKLEMTDSSILTVNAVALYLDSSTAMITNGKLQGQNLAVNLGGKNASVTLNGGDLSGDIWGVLVGGGSFTMLDGTVRGSQKGIWVSEARTKLIVKGGSVISDKVALYVENGSTVQLSGGTFTGGLNAIFAENGTMKNWLAKDCEMSGDDLPDLFDPASKSETGPGTVRIVEADYVGKAEAANEIMAQLPADSSEIEKDDLALIEAAEEAYNAASADKNVKKLLDKALVKRVKAARKAYDKNEKAAQKVQTLIDALPDASKLDYAKDRKTVDKAKKAYDKLALTPAQLTFLSQGSDTEPSAAEKLEACVEQIAILDTCADVLKAVQTAIKKLPTWERIKNTDKAKVEAAQKAMADLEAAEERLDRKIPIGEANEEKYYSSIAAYEDYKGTAEAYCEEHLTYLRTVKDPGREDGEKIKAARTAYNELGNSFEGANVAKNVQSFIPKADVTMLKTLEKQLTKNEKAALKITNLIKKLPTHGEPFGAKEKKAIEAAWKAYDGQKSEAVRSFVEGADTLTELYYQLHPELRPRVWSAVDRAYITHEEGNAVLKADVVDLDAKITTSTIKKFSSMDLSEYYDDTDISIDASLDAAAAKNFAYELATALKNLPNSEYSKDFNSLYDHLLKIAADKDGALSVKVGRYSNGAALNWAFGIHPYQLAQAKAEGKTVNLDDYTIKVVNGKPYLEITDDGQYSNASITPDKNDKDIALSSKTRFLVHNMDGTYSAYTGYKNVPSLIAHYAEVVFDADYTNELVAEVVYLTV